MAKFFTPTQLKSFCWCLNLQPDRQSDIFWYHKDLLGDSSDDLEYDHEVIAIFSIGSLLFFTSEAVAATIVMGETVGSDKESAALEKQANDNPHYRALSRVGDSLEDQGRAPIRFFDVLLLCRNV